MGLDTDDIVMLCVSIPLVVLGCVLLAMYLTVSTKYVKVFSKRMLQLRKKIIGQRVGKDGKIETYNKPVLQVLVGDDLYESYKAFLLEKYGKYPSPSEIDSIISPEALFVAVYYSMKPEKR